MPWDGSPNSFEIVGRYIAQTIQMERFLDLILLDEGVQPKRLLREALDLPPHYRQGIPYVALSDDELDDQAREAFAATELCRQLVERLQLAPLNPGMHFGRREPDWPPY